MLVEREREREREIGYTPRNLSQSPKRTPAFPTVHTGTHTAQRRATFRDLFKELA